MISFSTAQTVPHRVDRERDEFSFLRDDSVALRDLFEAAGDVVQESVLNSLCSADAMEGRDGNRAEAFPYELLERMGLPDDRPQKRRGVPEGTPRLTHGRRFRAPPRPMRSRSRSRRSDAFEDTHLPKAFVVRVPVLPGERARRRRRRAASHSFAAFLNSAASSASCSSAACSLALALLGDALAEGVRACSPFVPYFSANPVAIVLAQCLALLRGVRVSGLLLLGLFDGGLAHARGEAAELRPERLMSGVRVPPKRLALGLRGALVGMIWVWLGDGSRRQSEGQGQADGYGDLLHVA